MDAADIRGHFRSAAWGFTESTALFERKASQALRVRVRVRERSNLSTRHTPIRSKSCFLNLFTDFSDYTALVFLLVVLGKMRSAVGSAQLLISQKFQQFRELCEENLVSVPTLIKHAIHVYERKGV